MLWRSSVSMLVLHAAGEHHAARARAQLEQDAGVVAVLVDRGQRGLVHPDADARVVVALGSRQVRDELGGDRQLRLAGQQRDLVGDRGEVAPVQRGEALGAQLHDAAARAAKARGALEDAGAHVQHALVGEQRRLAEHERLLVDVEAHHRAVGRADDRLAGRREAERRLAVGNRPRLVKAVEEEARVVGRQALVVGAADAHVAVGDGEERLGLGGALEREAPRDEPPGIDRHGPAQGGRLAGVTDTAERLQARGAQAHAAAPTSGLTAAPAR